MSRERPANREPWMARFMLMSACVWRLTMPLDADAPKVDMTFKDGTLNITEERRMNIREIMSKSVVSCRPGDTLNTAAQLMWEHDCGAIPVTGDDGKLVGMITDRDICMATYTKGAAPHAISVADTMASRVFSCRADESVAAAERLMRDKQVRRIPVTDAEGKVLGLLSLSDVVRQATLLRKKDGPERELLQTIASICQPRSSGSKGAALVHTRKQVSAQT